MELDNNNRSVNRETIPNNPVGTGPGQPYLQNWLGPYNEGQLPEANGIGKITGPCGDTMMMYLRIGEERITRFGFKSMVALSAGPVLPSPPLWPREKAWRRPGILTNTRYSAVFRPSLRKKNIARCWPETRCGRPLKTILSRLSGIPLRIRIFASRKKLMPPTDESESHPVGLNPVFSIPQLYGAILKNLPVGFSLVDQEGIILEFNPAAERLTGYLRNEIRGKSHLQIFHGSSDPHSCPLFSQAFEQHTSSIATEGIHSQNDCDHPRGNDLGSRNRRT